MNRSSRTTLTLAIALALSWLLVGCGGDYWWGDGPGARAAVTTPSGIQRGDVSLSYTLSGDIPESDVTVEYSVDDGPFLEAARGSGGDGTRNLAVSPAGEPHTFVWASGKNLPAGREPSVVLRVVPEGGVPAETDPISVHNLSYLAATETRSASGTAGHVRLFSLDTVDGRVRLLQSLPTGGLDTTDIIHDDGFFFVANETSGTISAFGLDEAEAILTAVGSSPFGAGVAKPIRLATDGSRLFVSGSSGSVASLAIDSTTGALSFSSSLPLSASGAMVVRSGHLYLAHESAGEILILDILGDGSLSVSSSSPVTTGGLAAPRAMVLAGARIYAVSATSATICGFNILGGGALSPISGSPFSISTAAPDALGSRGYDLFAVAEGVESLVSLTADAFGVVTEDLGSPLDIGAPSRSVVSAGSAVVAGTTSGRLEVWTIDATTGALVPVTSFDAGEGVDAMALSD